MPISVPSRTWHIDWMRDDPVAWAKAARAQRQATALGQLGGGITRGAKNYLKGGMRGMIDKEYAEEQAKADREGAEMEARLGEQIGKAGDESQQPVQQGQPAVDQTTKAGEGTSVQGSALGESTGSWLSQLGKVGGVLKKIYRGPGTHYDITEVAKARGRLAGREDRRKDVEAISEAIKYQSDPGATIGQVYREGLGSIKPGQLHAAPNLAGASQGYRQALLEAGGDPSKVDPTRVRELDKQFEDEASRRKIQESEESAASQERHRAPEKPTAEAEKWQRVDEIVRQKYGDVSGPRLGRLREHEYNRLFGARSGRAGGSANLSRERLDREDQQSLEAARRAYASIKWAHEPTADEAAAFRGVKDPIKAAVIANQQRQMRGEAPAEVPPPATPPVPEPHGEAGHTSSQSTLPDFQPKQHDSRLGDPKTNPANRTQQRRDYNPMKAGPPDDDVPIFR